MYEFILAWQGALVAALVYAGILALHLVVPGTWVFGYVRDAHGRPLRYHLNGLRVFFVVIGTYAAVGYLYPNALDFFYRFRWQAAGTGCIIGLLFAAAIVFPYKKNTKSLIADYYLGRLENPRAFGGRLDAKMFLYLIGAAMLEINILSFAAHHIKLHAPDYSPGVILYCAMFSFFLMEYLYFEEVHLYTYDFFAERVGFKLGWGCLCFYPFVYGVGLWALAPRLNPHTPALLLAADAALFLGGWALSRGANLQKFWFKTQPQRMAFGWIAPVAIGDVKRQLLCSGFWALSRHINYLGELLMSTAIALSLGYPSSPHVWLYPLYYLVLLVPRQIADDARCEAKYGALWRAYVKRVPYRIVPWVY